MTLTLQTPTLAKATPPPWRAVFLYGPQLDATQGDELPTWTAYLGNAEGAPVGRVHASTSFAYAACLARSLAREHNVELIDHSEPA
jgi:hypothetical protein